MAISTLWTPFSNGDTGLAVRTALNTFNTNILSDMISTEGRVTTTEGTLTTNTANIATNTDDITALDVRVSANETYIADPKDSLEFVHRTQPVTHVEGQLYYDATSGSMKVQGPIPGVEVAVGHGTHAHVINNSGATIVKGTPVRRNGVAGGIVQIEEAQANTFVNARVLGVVQETILNGAEGAVVAEGSIPSLDTSALQSGVPIYLSATIPGGLTTTAPDIVTQVGGVLTQDALTGEFYVKIINNKNLPAVFGGMKGLDVPSIPLTTSPQDVTGYTLKEEIVILSDVTLGEITTSNDGLYRASVTAGISFPSSTSTRTVYVELYDATNATILFTYIKNIPRDATVDSFSFNYPFGSIADTKYKLRVSASTAITVAVDDVTFDIQSVNIR